MKNTHKLQSFFIKVRNIICGLIVLALFTGNKASANNITVTNNLTNGAGSLWDAIAFANSNPGPDKILFDPMVTGTITVFTTEFMVTDTLTIIGPGAANLSLVGTGTLRILKNSSLTEISGLTFYGGHANTVNNDFGGAIFNDVGGDLILDSCIFSANQATDMGGAIMNATSSKIWINHCSFDINASGVHGGAIYCYMGTDRIWVENSTFKGNTSGFMSPFGSGGAIYIWQNQNWAKILNCTFSANYTQGPNGQGGGVYLRDNYTEMKNCTFANNTNQSGTEGSALYLQDNMGNTLDITNTLIAANPAITIPLCSFSSTGNNFVVTHGGNLCQDTSMNAVLIDPLDQNGVDPQIEFPFTANTGGFTETHSLLPTSPAINAGVSGTTFDQRGYCRIGTTDIGAWEYNGVNGVPPNVELGSAITQCGGTVTLDAGNQGSTYAWSSTATSQTILTAFSGNYYVTVTNGCGVASDTISVTINDAPFIAFNDTVSVCADSVYIEGMPGYYPPGATYLWSTNSTDSAIYATSSGTYFETITWLNGCSASDTFVLVLNPLPIDNLGADTAQCGGIIMLDAGNPGSTYYWSGPNGWWSTNQTIIADTIGNYSVSVNLNGCNLNFQINIAINPIPDVTTNLSGATITANQIGATYQWLDCDNGNAIIVGETYQSFTATSNGDYAVIVTGASGTCTDTSACVNITGVGINETTTNHFSIYPNPTNGWITVKTASNDNGTIEVTNLQGKVVYKNTLNSNTQIINLSANAKGIYLVTVTTTKGVEVQKMAIQ